MYHGMKKRKFGRYSAHRKSMFRCLSKALIKHGTINTTLHKAKDLRPIVEKLITIAKVGDLNARRRLISILGGDCQEITMLIESISKTYQSRQGGYTRIIRAGYRQGDCAPMAMIQLI
jgi:large subunit ribosomal protein L17